MRTHVLVVLATFVGAIGVMASQAAHAEVGGAPFDGNSPPGELVEDASRLSLGHNTACVVLDNGNARCWGVNNVGQTGIGINQTPIGRDETPDTFPTVDLGGQRVLEIATQEGHSCALLFDKSVQCWGSGDYIGVPGAPSRVGDSEPPSSIDPVQLGGTVEAIALGNFHSCAILTSGAVRCWGDASSGQMGLGNQNAIGDDEDPASVGPVPLGPGRTAQKIDAGRFHTCALLDNSSIRCWGKRQAIPGQAETIGDGEPASSGPLLTTADFGGSKPVALSAGEDATCALTEAGDIWCWGQGEPSRWSTGSNTNNLVPALVDLGGRKAVALDAGFNHVCVIFEGGGVGCWGEGANGRLGYGDTDTVGDDEPPLSKGLVDLGTGRTAKAISAGDKATCALLDNDTLRCWGDAAQGAIGSGDTIDIGDDETPGSAPPVNYVGTATFRPVTPFRIVETRASEPGPGPIQGKGLVPPRTKIDVQVTGVGSIPTDDVYAVVLNLTLASSTNRGFVTTYPFGTARPTASNLNVTGPGQTAPNKVIVPVSTDGKISIYTQGGGHLVADVFGYFESAASSTGGRLIGVDPSRVVDTRPSEPPAGQKGKLPAGGEIEVKVTDRNGVPAAGVSAVVLNVTGVDGSDRGFITVYPGNVARPTTSNINLAGPGATRPNSVIVPVSPSGTIKIFSQQGAHIAVDVTGYFTDGTAVDTDDGLFARINPIRVGDTRDTRSSPLPKGGSTEFAIAGRFGIPFTANAAVFNITATQSLDRGFVTGYPSEIPRPGTSNLNLPGPGETIANLAVLPLRSPSGRITLFTQNGAHLLMDTTGYFL